jgi:hypothetical protein
MHTKPSGHIGPSTLSGLGVTWNRIEHPETKQELEQFYFDKFLLALKSTGLSDVKGVQNEENHFDFSLTTATGLTYVDMAELIIPQEEEGSPYKAQAPHYRFSQYADAVKRVIIKKSKKYLSLSKVPIQLLFYPTHWGFTIAGPIVEFIRCEIKSIQHVFNAIYFFQPIGNQEGVLYILHPAKCILPEDALKTMNNLESVPLNPNKWVLERK